MKNTVAKKFPAIALAISVAGVAFFYLIPFLVSLIYAFVENPIQMNFVGLKNFKELFKNRFFLMGIRNTFIFMGFGIPLSMISALFLAMTLKSVTRLENLLAVFFLVPFILPSATTVQFWSRIFANDGTINIFLRQFGIEGPQWLASEYTLGVMIFIYLWKNLGYNTVLFLAGLHTIPEAYYGCASVFGANAWQRFRYITMVYLSPTSFMVFILSFVNSFKIFREIYLMQGEFPHESIYLLQHFVNNTLLSLHYHRLVCAVYILTSIIVVVVIVTFYLEERLSRNLREVD